MLNISNNEYSLTSHPENDGRGCDYGVDDLNFVSGGKMIMCLETF